MNKLSGMSNLVYFSVDKYEFKTKHIFDFSNCPRPHFCMGLIIRGKADFCFDDKTISVHRGDIIFVPETTKYISSWEGEDILYVSIHFSFLPGSLFSSQKINEIQKIVLPDFDDIEKKFWYVFENYQGSSTQQLHALGVFYEILGDIYSHISFAKVQKVDERIQKAVEYINRNYTMEFSNKELAKICNMGESYFYSRFKKEIHQTPIEYKLKLRINRAMLLLIGSDKTIEEISAMLGFESSTYFRRVFKKITGQAPLSYRKSSIEI